MTLRIPFPKRQGKSSALVSLNSLSTVNRFEMQRIKERFKGYLGEWFIARRQNPAQGLLIRASILRHTKRKFDAINAAIALKWFEDVLEERGWVGDDTHDIFVIYPGRYEPGLQETMIEITIKKIKDGYKAEV